MNEKLIYLALQGYILVGRPTSIVTGAVFNLNRIRFLVYTDESNWKLVCSPALHSYRVCRFRHCCTSSCADDEPFRQDVIRRDEGIQRVHRACADH